MPRTFKYIVAATTLVASHFLHASNSPAAAPITFTEHVAPIVFENCASCHRPDEAAPFPLLSYRDVQKRAELILTVIDDGYMPPWHAQSKDFEFHGRRGLDPEEIETLVAWVDGGRLEGDPAKLPDLPQFTSGWQLGEPDLVVSMSDGYTLYAEGPDIYRNFAIPLNLDEDKWIQAIEFRPGNRAIVHHSLFYYDTTGEALAKDRSDPIPGYKTMGNGVERGGAIGGWAVGGIAKKLPEGLAYRLPKGSDLILSTHFHPSGKEETEVSTVGFYFSEKPPTQRFTAVQLPPAFGALARVNIPAGDPNYTKTDSFVLPVDVKAFGISSHAHYLGKRMNLSATLPDGTAKELLTIDDWDFSWQEQYQYKDYVALPAGTRLDAEVVWDNSVNNPNNPNDPPQRVRWGRESGDEMGSITLQMVAADPAEFGTLAQSIRSHVSEARKNARNARGRQNRLSNTIAPRIREQLITRFDTDKDGKLSAEEREAAQNALRRR